METLRLEGVRKSYGVGTPSERSAARDRPRLGRGVAALIGPSGSGKSTLLNVIGCSTGQAAALIHRRARGWSLDDAT